MRIALNYGLNDRQNRAVHAHLLRLPSFHFSMHVDGLNASRFASKRI